VVPDRLVPRGGPVIPSILASRSEGDGHEHEDGQRGQPEAQHASECGGRIFKPAVAFTMKGGGRGRRAQTLAQDDRRRLASGSRRFRKSRWLLHKPWARSQDRF